VTDTVTGLICLKQWDCWPLSTWSVGSQAAAALSHSECGLTDQSSPGDWRLPTKAEWAATIAPALGLDCGTRFPNSPLLTDTGGRRCYEAVPFQSPFVGLIGGNFYWSSSALASPDPSQVWVQRLSETFGQALVLKASSRLAWPVRGQR
jgi:hypothetical protein